MGAPATEGIKADVVRQRHLLLGAIRDFFYRRGYIEVETPYLNRTAPSDPYVEPLRVFVGGAGPYYLHTSPEIGMKKLIARGHGKIFQVCKAFRVEELEEHHSVEFTMLEWYMPGTYVEAMAETAGLVRAAGRSLGTTGAPIKSGPWPAYAVGDLFIEAAGFDPLPLDRASLFAAMEGRGFRGLSAGDSWEDLFFRCFVQQVEPLIRKKGEGPFFVKDWPVSLTAMARKKNDRAVERFELYIGGLEIANGYTELPRRKRATGAHRPGQRGAQAPGQGDVPPGQGLCRRPRQYTRPRRRCLGRGGQASDGPLRGKKHRGRAAGQAHPGRGWPVLTPPALIVFRVPSLFSCPTS